MHHIRIHVCGGVVMECLARILSLFGDNDISRQNASWPPIARCAARPEEIVEKVLRIPRAGSAG